MKRMTNEELKKKINSNFNASNPYGKIKYEKGQIKALGNEINENFDKWLKASDLTIDSLKQYKTVNGFTVMYDAESRAFILGYKNEEGLYSPIGSFFSCSDDYDFQYFFLDAFAVYTKIAAILDQSNQTEPVNGSYPDNHFKSIISKLYDKYSEYFHFNK